MAQAVKESIESRVKKIEKELSVIKLTIKKRKLKKIKLNRLVNRISAKAKPLETTSLIREMRKKNYE